AGARPVLGDGALREVHVEIDLGVEVLLEPERGRSRAHVAHRRLRRLLHHVAELTGNDELALAGDNSDLRRQKVAAILRDSETISEADLVLLFLPAEPELRHAKILEHKLGQKLDERYSTALLILDDLTRHLAAHASDLALEDANASLFRVVVDDRSYCSL